MAERMCCTDAARMGKITNNSSYYYTCFVLRCTRTLRGLDTFSNANQLLITPITLFVDSNANPVSAQCSVAKHLHWRLCIVLPTVTTNTKLLNSVMHRPR